ncbi:HutD protein [Aneurinibacillus soli]|uniref:Uncharacterized protein n=2 Tax=Aneurinibacillus soli TaxID=1500254 RepID=A0A0U5AVR8_9BACL|nr:HutD family protein [Aneurinibacillus soli]PYE58952.1 HutD protein [Aneurinibacillus soli]BAU26032.1 hypothetical protein CB4_00104 [Aneurinibacillus soli]
MSYSIKMMRKNEQTTSLWSGGITTQLAIYPEDADYTKRDFKWRISSADVEVEESVFTPLPSIQRIIMIMEGEMFLQHEGKHQVLLKPFEQDRFSGDWTTRSMGRVKDFNLMLAEGCSGELHAIHIKKGIHNEVLDPAYSREGAKRSEAFYCVNGSVRAIIDENEVLVLEKGDVMIVNAENLCKTIKVKVCNHDELAASIIRASIFY